MTRSMAPARKKIVEKSSWKALALNTGPNADDVYENLIGIEELVDYKIITNKRKRKKDKTDVEETEDDNDLVEDSEIEENDEIPIKRKKIVSASKGKKKKRNKVVSRKEVGTLENLNPAVTSDLPDSSAWKDLYVPELVLKSLLGLGYLAPTPIQSLTLPSAIRDRRDIVAAAETGSGKTLAFGIPIIHTILQNQEEKANETNNENSKNDADTEIENDATETEENIPKRYWLTDEDRLNLDVNVIEQDKYVRRLKNNSQLQALMLTPTRELAIQVKNHLKAAAKFTGIKVITVIGGLASQKQRRLLSKSPEIIVATPGRLWELYEEGHPYVRTIVKIKSLVIDEADRMLEKGHFSELMPILDVINSEDGLKEKRQTFIFSATLTLIHDIPQRLLLKKRKKKLTQNDKLDAFMKIVGIKDNPKIVDITKPIGTAELLTEAQLNCSAKEKDNYLYYFLIRHPGRTLVFCNSIDCVRRLINIFGLLQCTPLPLHADMHQKQRLKNLERFSASEKGLLIATDVAARGLDIPNIQHVIHYQIPRISEVYIHRSGRTARASNEGLSVLLISPDEALFYRKICRTLKRDEDLPLFPVDKSVFEALKTRVKVAQELDIKEHRWRKLNSQNNWFIEAAEKMDIELDEELLLNDLGDDFEKSRELKLLQSLRKQLTSLLKEPIKLSKFSGKYPTKTGKLILPTIQESKGALNVVREEKVIQKKLLKNIPHQLSKNQTQKKKLKRKKQKRKK